MQIIEAKIENFLTIGDAKLGLNNRGLVLIQGDNRDDPSAKSNGAGKSSIPDAICWALYGKTARGITGDAVINSKAKKNCRVAITIRDDADSFYCIARHRKHEQGKSALTVTKSETVNGVTNTVDLTKGTDKLTQEVVDQLMGCSHEVFTAAVYAGQEAMPDLPSMTDKQLKVLVEEAAGIDRLQKAHEIAKQRKNEAQQELINKQSRQDAQAQIVANLQMTAQQLEQARDNWVSEQARKIQAQLERVKEIAKEAMTLKGLVNENRIAIISQDLCDLSDRLCGRRQEEAQEQQLANDAMQAQRTLSNADAAYQLAINELNRKSEALSNVDHRVGKPCGECGKTYTKDDMAGATQAAQTALDAAREKQAQLLDAKDQAERNATSASERLSQFRASMTDVSEVIAAQRDLEDEKRSLEVVIREYERKKQEAQQAAEQVSQMKAETNPYEKLISDNRQQIEAGNQTLRQVSNEVDQAVNDLELHNEAVKVFGPSGVRAHILDSVTPFLNDRTGHYLGNLSDGNISAMWSTLTTTATGAVREKFNISVKNGMGASNFAGLSGGEKRKARLATAMALQDLVASRASKPIHLFIADEVDHALDESGLERLMALLDEKAKERGTVLVISHNELSDWIREQVTVIKQGGSSRVEGVLTM